MPEPRRHRVLWHIIGCALIMFVIYQSLTPAPMEIPGDEGSRFAHLAAYGTLMGWFAHLHEARSRRIRLALGFVAMGVALEAIQGATGYRTTDLVDALANTLGVCAGWLLAPPRLPNLLALTERYLDRDQR